MVRPGRGSTQEVMKPPLCDEGVFVDYLCAEYLCLSLLASIANKDRGEVLPKDVSLSPNHELPARFDGDVWVRDLWMISWLLVPFGRHGGS